MSPCARWRLVMLGRVLSGLQGRVWVMLVALLVSLAGSALATTPTGTITEAQFTELATQILEYLGYAIAAGLTVLVAVVGARRAWAFLRRFF